MYCSRENSVNVSYAVGDHQKLIAAIRNKEKDKAVELLTEHIERAKSRVLSGFIRFFK